MSEEFDDLLRSRLRSENRTSPHAHAALDSLKPAMRRARRRHNVAVGTMTVGTVVFAGVGAVVLGAALSSPEPAHIVSSEEALPPVSYDDADQEASSAVQTTVLDPSGDDGDSTTTVVIPIIPGHLGTQPPDDPDAPTTTTAAGQTPPTISTTPPAATTTAPLNPTPAPTSSVAPSTVPTTIVVTTTTPPPPPTTGTPATTTVPSTTTTVPSTHDRVLSTKCGTIDVTYDDTTVVLVSTHPAAGFTYVVENDGPEEVEVSFVGNGDECQIHAEMRGGRLVVEDAHE